MNLSARRAIAQRTISVVLVVCVVGVAYTLFVKRDQDVQQQAEPEREERTAEAPAKKAPVSSSIHRHAVPHERSVVKQPALPPVRKRLIPEIASLTEDLNSPDLNVYDDLEIIESVLDYYRRIYRDNPVAGLNVEVADALTGGNRKGLAFIPPGHPAISAKGELLDRWGTPYFFHALSAKEIEIVSAGPDRILWSHDDVRRE